MTTMTTKPDVCIADFTIRYVEKKHMNKVKHKTPSLAKKYTKMYVKEFKINDYPLTLDANNKFPTENTKQRTLRGIWMFKFKSDKFENFVMYFKDINVKSRSKVNYEFDPNIH
jgi:hypothetical protein